MKSALLIFAILSAAPQPAEARCGVFCGCGCRPLARVAGLFQRRPAVVHRAAPLPQFRVECDGNSCRKVQVK